MEDHLPSGHASVAPVVTVKLTHHPRLTESTFSCRTSPYWTWNQALLGYFSGPCTHWNRAALSRRTWEADLRYYRLGSPRREPAFAAR